MKFLTALSLGIVFALAMIPQIFAISVVSDFLENDTIILNEGESRLYGIRLQNGKNYPEYFQVTYDKKYASIVDYQEQYEVSPKSSLSIKFNITAERFPVGELVPIGYTVHEMGGSGEGVPLLLKINKNFNVKVNKTQETSGFSRNLAIALLLIILFVAYRVYFRLKKPKKKKKEFL